MAQRRVASAAASILPEPPTPRVRVVEPLPPPVLPVRTGVLAGEDLSLVGRRVPLTLPMQWELPGPVDGPTLERFLLHYMEWVDGLDDATCLAFIEDWIEANPRRGVRADWAAWSPYAVAVRCIVWMETLARRPCVPPARVRRSLAQQLDFLHRHLEWDLGGNHLLKDLTALLLGARFFTGAAASRWRRTAERALAVELERQFLDDGMHFERSPAYHDQVAADLIRCHAGVRDAALRARLAQTLDAAVRVGAQLTHPDRLPSLFADGGLHLAHPRAVLDAAWPAPEPAPGGFALPDAGYYGFRAEGELFLAFFGRIGPDHLPAHGHGDIGSFEWSVGGRRLVVDAGVFEYVDGPRRRWSRSTRAHNTVTVGDADQAEFYGAFRVGRRPSVAVRDVHLSRERLELFGSHTGFAPLAGAPIHSRRFAVSAGRVEVEDRVEGGAGQRVVARLLLHPEVEVELVPWGARLRRDGAVFHLRTDVDVRGVRVRWSPDFGVEREATQLELDYGPAPVAGAGFSLVLARIHHRVGESGASVASAL